MLSRLMFTGSTEITLAIGRRFVARPQEHRRWRPLKNTRGGWRDSVPVVITAVVSISSTETKTPFHTALKRRTEKITLSGAHI